MSQQPIQQFVKDLDPMVLDKLWSFLLLAQDQCPDQTAEGLLRLVEDNPDVAKKLADYNA